MLYLLRKQKFPHLSHAGLHTNNIYMSNLEVLERLTSPPELGMPFW